MASANVSELNDTNFDQFISSASLPVVVDFWASWCGPCRMLAPVLEEIAVENSGKFLVAKVNVDDCPHVASRFGIQSIPTLVYFSGGTKRDQSVGVIPKAEIVRRLQALS